MRVIIEKLIYGGDGLARLAPDDQNRRKAVFVPFTIDGEQADVLVTDDRPSFARATAEQIVAPSPHRVGAPCPYFFRCGGCQYQHIDYAHQLATKAAILRETVARIAKVDVPGEIEIHSAEPWNYRNRTRLHVQTLPEFAIGYHRANSNQLLAVEVCPISSPLINRALAALWQAGREGLVPDGIREIQLFADHSDSRLLVEFYVVSGTQVAQRVWDAFSENLPEAEGLAVLPALGESEDSERAPLAITAARTIQSFGSSHMAYEAGGHTYRVSAGAFFQTNRFLINELVRLVASGASGTFALDLYSGAGLFTLPLAAIFSNVTSVESSPQSFQDLRRNVPSNVEPLQKRVDALLQQRQELTPDYVVVDPPRAGLGEKVANALGRMNTARVTYVSCEPSTLSRDLRVLLQSGFRIQKAHLVDLFPQTFHIESVFELTR